MHPWVPNPNATQIEKDSKKVSMEKSTIFSGAVVIAGDEKATFFPGVKSGFCGAILSGIGGIFDL